MNEESNTKVCYVLSAKCAEKHQEKAVETAEESKNVVQGESYVGGRVLQLCAAQKCCKEFLVGVPQKKKKNKKR
jgi:hypothetical protein